MRTNCSNCPYGGFYDHRTNKDFMSEEEQNKYYMENEYTEDEYSE